MSDVHESRVQVFEMGKVECTGCLFLVSFYHCILSSLNSFFGYSLLNEIDNARSYKEYKEYKEYKFKILSYKRNCQDNKNIIPLIKCYFGFISCTFKNKNF